VVSLADVKAARERIRPYVHETPLLSSEQLSRELGINLYFKAEHLQKVGAFKARGAANTVYSLTDEQAANGVATHSSGNHGAALARAAQLRGIPAHVVVPQNANQTKVDAIASYGAHIIRCESTLAAREASLADVVTNTGAEVVHPYDDPRVIAGQGTCALEVLEQMGSHRETLHALITPVGGGGLLAGSAVVVKARNHGDIFGAEPEGADDAYRSFKSGVRVTDQVPNTIADGLRTTLGERNFEIIKHDVDDVFVVSEEEIVHAMKLIWTRLKQVVEASSAVPFAALSKNRERFQGQTVCLVLTGGNVDLSDLPF
jgi:threonine dehydratase